MKEPQWFRNIRFESKYLIEEIILAFKHPTRKATYIDIRYHWYKLWDHILFHPWYCLVRGIKNIWNWKGVIWSNDIWDHYFLTKLIDKQMKGMEDFWKEKSDEERSGEPNEKGWRCQYRRIYKRIKWSRKLMQMWLDEHYAMTAFDMHYKKFTQENKSIFEHDPEQTTYDSYGVPILFTMKPMPEDEREVYRASSEIAREKDEKVFKLWVKSWNHVRNFWH